MPTAVRQQLTYVPCRLVLISQHMLQDVLRVRGLVYSLHPLPACLSVTVCLSAFYRIIDRAETGCPSSSCATKRVVTIFLGHVVRLM